MDDPMQWKCVLDRLLPFERATVLRALPQAQVLAPVYNSDPAVNSELIKHGLSHLVRLDNPNQLYNMVARAAYWDNHDTLSELVRRNLESPETLDRMLTYAIEYGTAASLEAFADALGDVELPAGRSMQAATGMAAGADLNKLEVLKRRFGLPYKYGELRADAPAPVFRLYNELGTEEMLERLAGQPALDPSVQYEYIRRIWQLEGGKVPPELEQLAQDNARIAALVETVEHEIDWLLLQQGP